MINFKVKFTLLVVSAFTISSFTASNAIASTTPTKIPGLIVAKGKLSQDHKTTNLGYNLSKAIPMGGAHHPGWATCMAYTTPVAAEYAIHSMEHGAIWIAYDSTLKSAELNTLTAYAKNDPFLLLTPVKKAPNPITVTAWGFQLKLEKASDPRIKTFIKNYQNSKTTPELGAPCQSGISDPNFLSKPQPLKK
jgi:hypothetical protein